LSCIVSAASYCTAIDLLYNGTNHTINYGSGLQVKYWGSGSLRPQGVNAYAMCCCILSPSYSLRHKPILRSWPGYMSPRLR